MTSRFDEVVRWRRHARFRRHRELAAERGKVAFLRSVLFWSCVVAGCFGILYMLLASASPDSGFSSFPPPPDPGPEVFWGTVVLVTAFGMICACLARASAARRRADADG